MTQQQLADLSTVSVRTVRDIELGQVNPRSETLRLIAEALGLGPHQHAALLAAMQPSAIVAPSPISPLIGRALELDALTTLFLEDAWRLVTVVGLEGVGKTRLAAAAARIMRARAGLAVYWISFDDRAPHRIIESGPSGEILTRIRTLLMENDVEQVGALIGGHPALIVLDGLDERILQVEAVVGSLEVLPSLRALVTARIPPDTPVAVPFPLAPLAVADPHDDIVAAVRLPAVQLFLTHLRQLQPGWEPGQADLAAISSICRAVDGLPAAVELATRWSVVRPPDQVAELLDRDPLSVLVPHPSAPASQGLGQSLRHSVTMLPSPLRRLLTSLCLLDGDWSADHVQSAHDVYRLLSYGLIRRLDYRTGPRFQVLNLIRAAMADHPEPDNIAQFS